SLVRAQEGHRALRQGPGPRRRRAIGDRHSRLRTAGRLRAMRQGAGQARHHLPSDDRARAVPKQRDEPDGARRGKRARVEYEIRVILGKTPYFPAVTNYQNWSMPTDPP